MGLAMSGIGRWVARACPALFCAVRPVSDALESASMPADRLPLLALIAVAHVRIAPTSSRFVLYGIGSVARAAYRKGILKGQTMKLDTLSDDRLAGVMADTRLELQRRVTLDTPFKAIKGQEHCKRALIVAAVQGHSVVVYGPHGAGKSMLVEAGAAIGVSVIERLPCPCGNYTDPRLPCKCTPVAITRHARKLADVGRAADIHVECPPVPARELLSGRHGTTLEHVREQLAQAGALPGTATLDEPGRQILKTATSELGLSARTVATCLSVAQSVAALAGQDTLTADCICEAVHYRPLDRLCA